MANCAFMTGKEQAYSSLVFLGIGDKNSADRACGNKMCSAAGAGVDVASVDIDNANIRSCLAELIGKLSEWESGSICPADGLKGYGKISLHGSVCGKLETDKLGFIEKPIQVNGAIVLRHMESNIMRAE